MYAAKDMAAFLAGITDDAAPGPLDTVAVEYHFGVGPAMAARRLLERAIRRGT